MNLIGFDFSINKPAACVYSNNEYLFFSWPYGFKDKVKNTFRHSGISLIDRTDDKIKGDNISEIMRYEIKNAKYLANLIKETLNPFLNRNTLVAFEGLSYASGGRSILQMGGYKYLLMNELNSIVPLENMFTYSPNTIKSVAESSKRGMGKSEMIAAFILKGPDSEFKTSLAKGNFRNKKNTAWEIHVDDLVDSFWCIETLRKRESFAVSSRISTLEL